MTDRKSVLSFGAGRVAPGFLDYLQRSGYDLAVADMDGEQARRMSRRFGLGDEHWLEASADHPELQEIVGRYDAVASLLPHTEHFKVAEACVAARVPLVTPSYPDPPIRALDAAARRNGTPILVEMGLDPGIDHAKTVSLLAEIHGRGGRVLSLRSFCGSLPAPECSHNSLRFKIGWSLKAIIGVATEQATYQAAPEPVIIPPERIFSEPWIVDLDGFDEPFEAYPNRDSLPYVEQYGLEPDVDDFVRGNFRYPGWSHFWRGLRKLGWPREELPADWSEIEGILGDEFIHGPGSRGFEILRSRPRNAWQNTVEQLERLFEATEDLHFSEGERDMVVMVIQCLYELPSGERRKARSSLVLFGEPERDPDPSQPEDHGNIRAISHATGAAMGHGARLILEGALKSPGVVRPVEPGFATQISEMLVREKIVFEDSDVAVS